MMGRAPTRHRLLVGAVLALALAFPLRLAAQDADTASAWLPTEHAFLPLLADPREIRLGGAIIATDVLRRSNTLNALERPPFSFLASADDMETDVQGDVALGGTILLRRAPVRGGNLVVGAQAAVFARFRIEEPSRDYAASDWIVALPVEWRRDRVAARLRLLHRSSHLGDEIIVETGARRIEFGHEAIDLLLAYTLDSGARLYGGGSWIFRSNTENEPLLHALGRPVTDNAALQAGVDGAWYPWADGRLGVVAGVDWQAAQRTDWKSQLSAIAGLVAKGEDQRLRLQLRFFHGASPLGEFFLSDETYFGLEIAADL